MRIGCAALMTLLSLFTVALLLVFPKPDGGTAVGVVLGVAVSAAVLARAIALFRGGKGGTRLVRRASPLPYAVVVVFLVLAVAAQFIEPSTGSAYSPALAGLFVGGLIREEPVPDVSRGTKIPVQRSVVIAVTCFCVAAAGVTVGMVLAILAGRGALVEALIVASVLLWTAAFVAIARLNVPLWLWAPQRIQAAK